MSRSNLFGRNALTSGGRYCVTTTRRTESAVVYQNSRLSFDANIDY